MVIRLMDGAEIEVAQHAPGVWVPAGSQPGSAGMIVYGNGFHAPDCRCAACLPAPPHPTAMLAQAVQAADAPPPADLMAQLVAGPDAEHPDGCQCKACQKRLTEETRALIEQPLGWPDESTLPQLATVPPGTCAHCHRGPLAPGSVSECVYCRTAAQLSRTMATAVTASSPAPAAARQVATRDARGHFTGNTHLHDSGTPRCRICEPGPSLAHVLAARATWLAIGIALYVLAVHLAAPIFVPAIVCVTLALGPRRRHFNRKKPGD
jgi:hypothetical protein